MTYNILYGGVGREQLIRDVVTAIHPDIGVFTEVTEANSFELIADAVGSHRAGRRGRAAREYPVIVSRWPIIQSDLHGPPWAPRKWVEATLLPFGGPPVTVHGVHLVPQSLWPFELWRRWEVRWLLKRLLASGCPHIVAGDFNALIGRDTQRREGAPVWVRAQWLLQGGTTPRWALKVLTDAGYVDCYRVCNTEKNGFTVPAWDPGARIDYVFASSNLKPALRSSGTLESRRSPDSSRMAPSRSLAELLGLKAVKSLGGEASLIICPYGLISIGRHEAIGRQRPANNRRLTIACRTAPGAIVKRRG
jgi:endonuclease/exonuclease/phosphatase family metal-dependent hydrolase